MTESYRMNSLLNVMLNLFLCLNQTLNRSMRHMHLSNNNLEIDFVLAAGYFVRLFKEMLALNHVKYHVTIRLNGFSLLFRR